MKYSGRKLTSMQRRDLTHQLIRTYEIPSERALTQALQELGVVVSHAAVSRLCRELGVYRRSGVCGADPYLTSDIFDTQLCPKNPLWYFYARIGSVHYKGLRRTEDRDLLKRARQLTVAHREGHEDTVARIKAEFLEAGHKWWR
jgi:hypothetical protein